MKKPIAILLFLCLGAVSASLSTSAAYAEEQTITINAAGDCTFSSDIKQNAATNFFAMYNQQKNPAYFFKKVRSVFQNDDLSIVNFEGTLSNRGTRANKKWAFRGKPQYTKILTSGSIEAVGFANNHVRDYGVVSYQDTKDALKKAGVLYSSAENVSVTKIKGVKIAMVSISSIEPFYHPTTKLRQLLKKAKKKKPDILIVNMHSGTEYTNSPTATQKQLAHIAVDEGKADLVIGHHPHVIQGIEKRKGSLIAYSLGNFVFGGNTNPSDKDTMILNVSFTVKNKKVVGKPKAKIIPCSLSSVTYRNDYQPKLVDGAAKKRILQRVRQMSKPYGVTITKNGVIK